MGVAVFALPGRCSRAGAVLVFGHEVHFAWQAQGIRHIGASERSFYVAGARNRSLCKFRGRRSVLWTLQKRWQACVIRRTAFRVAGAGETAEFVRGVEFLEFELEDDFAWPVQHFV